MEGGRGEGGRGEREGGKGERGRGKGEEGRGERGEGGGGRERGKGEGGGGSHLKITGVLVGKFRKTPCVSNAQTFFFNPRGTNFKHNIYIILGFSTFSRANLQILTPKRYDEQSCHFNIGVWGSGGLDRVTVCN